MGTLRALNLDRGTELASDVRLAQTASARILGLLLQPELPTGSALLLLPCRGVHTFGMRFAIDVTFLDGEGRVIRVYRALRPFRVTRWVLRARAALELPSGTLDRTGTLEGDRLAFPGLTHVAIPRSPQSL